MSCSGCKAQLYCDTKSTYEHQKTGALLCDKCAPKEDKDLLELNILEAHDAGVNTCYTRMRADSSMPNRRAEELKKAQPKKK
jgi:hypothetical protein